MVATAGTKTLNALDRRDYILRLEIDESASNPIEDRDGMWSLYTFKESRSTRDVATNASMWDWVDEKDDGGYRVPMRLMNKLRAGTAFWLDLYRNWQSEWRVIAPGLIHPEDRDGDFIADGILVWEHPIKDMGAKTVADRAEDATGTLEEYNNWAGGNVFGYDLTARDGGRVTSYTTGDGKGGWRTFDSDSDSCWGFIGEKYFVEMLRDEVLASYAENNPIRVIVTGGAKWVADGSELKGIANVEIVERFDDTDEDGEEIDEY